MRVVSLVPSWTETLLECGVNVVARTRYCVHPRESVQEIPVVGGTKDLKLETLLELKPDLLLLDKDENLPWMAEQAGCAVHCTHVQSTDDVPRELDSLSVTLKSSELSKVADRWRKILESPAYPKEKISELPGVLRWLKEPEREPETIIYVIWRGPWMAASRNTFVGAMLSQVGFGGRIPSFEKRFPEIDLENFNPDTTVLLFSSEPYPFAKKAAELKGLNFASAIVDGEAYSWFGLRSLKFLEGLRE